MAGRLGSVGPVCARRRVLGHVQMVTITGRGLWFSIRVAALVACVDDVWFPVTGAAAVQLEQRGRGRQLAELGVAVAARVEVRALLGDDVAHGSEMGPAVLVAGSDRIRQNQDTSLGLK